MIARSLDVLGLVAFFQNDLAGARRMYEEAIASARTAGDDWCTPMRRDDRIDPLVGEHEAAREAGREAFAHARRRNDLQGMRMALFALALTARRMGDHDAARVEGDEGLAISRRLGDPFFASYFLWVLASVAHDRATPTVRPPRPQRPCASRARSGRRCSSCVASRRSPRSLAKPATPPQRATRCTRPSPSRDRRRCPEAMSPRCFGHSASSRPRAATGPPDEPASMRRSSWRARSATRGPNVGQLDDRAVAGAEPR